MSDTRDRDLAFLVVGLGPAAAACTRVVDALWLSLAVLIVLTATRALLRFAHEQTGPAPAWGTLLVTACAAALVELAASAALPATTARLGIALPLLAVTVPSMGQAADGRTFSTVRAAAAHAMGRGAAFAAFLVAVTIVREILGAGTITLGRTIPVSPFFQDPARALALPGGALLCLGYAVAAARALRRRTPRDGGQAT